MCVRTVNPVLPQVLWRKTMNSVNLGFHFYSGTIDQNVSSEPPWRMGILFQTLSCCEWIEFVLKTSPVLLFFSGPPLIHSYPNKDSIQNHPDSYILRFIYLVVPLNYGINRVCADLKNAWGDFWKHFEMTL